MNFSRLSSDCSETVKNYHKMMKTEYFSRKPYYLNEIDIIQYFTTTQAILTYRHLKILLRVSACYFPTSGHWDGIRTMKRVCRKRYERKKHLRLPHQVQRPIVTSMIKAIEK